MADFLEIVDTAIKIGLGAVITTIGTLVLAKQNHGSDKDKRRFERRLAKMEQASDEFDAFLSKFSRLLAAVDGARKSMQDEESKIPKMFDEFIQKRDTELVDQRPSLTKAISTLSLLGLSDTAKIAGQLGAAEEDLRKPVIFDERVPAQEELNALRSRVAAIRRGFYSSLSSHYKSD